MTKEKATQLIPLLQAYTEGKIIQFKKRGTEWIDLPEPYFDYSLDTYRIKPENKYRAWTFEEAPLNVVFKLKDTPFAIKFIFYSIDRNKGYYDAISRCFYPFDKCLEEYLYSSDNGKIWLPCGVLI